MNLRQLVDEVEAVSQVYAQAHGIERNDAWLLLKLHEEVGELTQAFLARAGQSRDRGRSEAERERDLRAELADVLCHVLLLARRFDVDLEAEVESKWLVWSRT